MRLRLQAMKNCYIQEKRNEAREQQKQQLLQEQSVSIPLYPAACTNSEDVFLVKGNYEFVL